MSTDKIVTHEDLPYLRYIREAATSLDQRLTVGRNPLALLDRLIAAAEADQPPLPEGWVLLRMLDGARTALWHRDGVLYQWDDCTVVRDSVEGKRDRLTPLRPTVTEADIEKAARAARDSFFAGAVNNWDAVDQGTRDDWMKTARAALDALGIERDES